MIGWIVEKISSSGCRMKCRRFRAVTTVGVARRRRSSRGEQGGAAGAPSGPSRPGCPRATAHVRRPSSLGAAPVSCRNTSSSVGRRRPMSLTAIPARRSSAAASSTSSSPSRGAGKPEPGPGARPARARRSPPGRAPPRALSRCAALDSSTSSIWPPTRSLSSLPVPFGDHPPVVDHRDPVGELVGLLQVLGGQQDRRALAPQLAHDRPDLVAAARVEAGGRLVQEEHPRAG